LDKDRSRSAGIGADGEKASGICVPGLVKRQAESTPDAVALTSGPRSVTYSELDRRANQLSNYLHSLGVTSGSVIGLCLERSVDFPIAALAILKTGCAYLPLETNAPPLRLQTMLNGARVPVVITNQAASESLRGTAAKLVALERVRDQISGCSPELSAAAVSPEQLAYVIYTSGSTGTPKAVAIGHGSLLNLCQWHNRAFKISAADRATQLASISFDAAVWELWPYLIAGASVHLVDGNARTQPEQLRDYLVREKISISFAPTPLAEQLLKLSWPPQTALRFLLTGADTLHCWAPANLPFTLVNNYGPTECTVVATSGIVPAEDSGDRLPPIGKAIDNAEIYILDEQLNRVPDGDVGEIYIGGAGLAKGYLNDPALTAQRFISNPFGAERLYRTGDLGSFRRDGQVAFHGRVDDQVKISGYRIELNEIAGVLGRYAAIRESVIVARDNEQGQKQLVAYIVPKSTCPGLGELRDFLSKELPEYMLPGRFVRLDSLPLGTSGKVDRSALPAPNDTNVLRDDSFQGPRTPTEQRVAAIVSSLLGLQQVGIKDNFFYLGGNSLFGTQVIARIRDSFNVEISLLKLFDHPTVAELAAEVERLIVAKLDSMSDEEAQRLLDLNIEQTSA